jgi:hypothetical protein
MTSNRAGVVYDQALPDTAITAFGVYVTKPSGDMSARFDNFEIQASSVPQSTPFQDWISANAPAGAAGPLDDPDSDGTPNLLEFALKGNPTDGSDVGLSFPRIMGEGEFKELILTIAVRTGALFVDGVATVDGITYEIEATHDLDFPSAGVISNGPFTIPPAGSGQPDLTGSDWEYHSFKIEPRAAEPGESEAVDTSRGFLRIKVSQP